MATGSGISAQLMVAEESTWGTAVTVTRAYELRSEGIGHDIGRINSDGIRSGQRVQRSEDWLPGAEKISGSVELELSTKNWALLGKHMMGSVSTSGAGPYTHTLTTGDLTGKGLTVQVGRPDVSGTVQPFTFAGCKVAGWELSCEAGNEEPALVTLDLVGKSETTATALATASYTASNALFAWPHLAVTIAGSGVSWRSFSIKGTNPFKDDRYKGGATTIDEPIENGMREYTGSITLDFDTLTQYNRYVGGNEAALVATFTRSTDIIAITTNARFDGIPPAVDNRDLLQVEIPFKCVGPTTDASAITVAVTSSEATP